MSDITSVENKIITLRDQQVILDADVAELYGVETRDINKAVRNNPEKFPPGYIFEINESEKNELVENFHRFERQKHSTVFPKAFTEKGLYMLATILKYATNIIIVYCAATMPTCDASLHPLLPACFPHKNISTLKSVSFFTKLYPIIKFYL